MIKVAIMGCGTIGSGVYEVIEKNQEILQKEIGDEIRVARILDLRQFPGTPYEKLVTGDFSAIENDPEISIVVETMGGTKPAYQFVKACLLKGKHVVTSNKALVAAHGTELLQIAREKSINFFFEAAVGGGIPVIRTLGTGYAGQEITEITGILNGTTNYILTEMDRKGAGFGDALAEAQRLGYAERNPEADIEGYDTCRKISILTSLMTDKAVDFEKVYTEGITKIDTLDLAYAKKLNAAVKLVGSAVRENGKIVISVCPKLIPEDNPLYSVSGVFNGILIRGNMLGVTMLYGSGAGKLPTASAVVADIIEAAKNPEKNVPFGWHEGETLPEPMEESLHRYLIRFKGSDEEKAQKVFAGAETVRLDGEEEFALFTSVMQEKDLRAAAEQFDNIIKVIRA
ncbi:MAG: homoserine dehydrogenase [Stomatobaculum sp.]|nr:homoserine dehydrogenase [Stomatobaculum sp.]